MLRQNKEKEKKASDEEVHPRADSVYGGSNCRCCCSADCALLLSSGRDLGVSPGSSKALGGVDDVYICCLA